jgi:hypothetical protein
MHKIIAKLVAGTLVAATLVSGGLAGSNRVEFRIAREVRNPRLPASIGITLTTKPIPITDDEWQSLVCRLREEYVVRRGFGELSALIFNDYQSARRYVTPTDDTPHAHEYLNHEIAEYRFSKTAGRHALDLVRREQEKTIIVKHFDFSLDACRIAGAS